MTDWEARHKARRAYDLWMHKSAPRSITMGKGDKAVTFRLALPGGNIRPMPFDLVESVALLNPLLAELDEQELDVITRYHILGETFREISDRDGRSLERMRQIKAKAFRKIRALDFKWYDGALAGCYSRRIGGGWLPGRGHESTWVAPRWA